MPYTVLLVDDHKIMRDGIKTILERTQEFTVVGEAETGADAVAQARKLHPELVLMDIGLPGMNGIEATIEVIRHCPNSKVMILSMYDDENSVVAAFRSGARAFLLKKASSGDLLDALRTVARGGSYLSSQVSDHLLTRIQRGDLESKNLPGPLDGLSPREQQVLRLVAEGKNQQGHRRDARSGIANCPHLSQDPDEEDRRHQYCQPHPGRSCRRTDWLGTSRA